MQLRRLKPKFSSGLYDSLCPSLSLLATSICIVASLFAKQAYAERAVGEPAYNSAKSEFDSQSYGSAAPTRLLWGEMHLHTSMSSDAAGSGNLFLQPADAYRFAKGDPVMTLSGEIAQLKRPLDFMVITDHANSLGVIDRIRQKDPMILATEIGERWARRIDAGDADQLGSYLQSDDPEKLKAFARSVVWADEGNTSPNSFFWESWQPEPGSKVYEAEKERFDTLRARGRETGFVTDEDFRRSVWQEVCENADRHNSPGHFTAFIGYEWTPRGAGTRRARNLHRNVIFKDSGEKACQIRPFAGMDSENVEDLWAFLARYEATTNGEVMAIGHNGNLSRGRMFSLTDFNYEAITADYAQRRAKWEPLYEITQYKGDSETHPAISPNDEFADFERWTRGHNVGLSQEEFEEEKRGEYVRGALLRGLEQQAKLGVNPFNFGFVGATDSHTSIAAAAEDQFWGKHAIHEPSPFRVTEINAAKFAASGRTAVWARSNTRDAIFHALDNKETYATTGPRISLRFFGGWAFDQSDADLPDLSVPGYAKGVPMGGQIFRPDEGRVPSFLVRALKDPLGANLDRVQVVKGWYSSDGEQHERVYDVVVSDDREIPGDGASVTPVGNTVNLSDASYTNTIGDPELSVVWRDPDFDPDELAFYYVRVLEIPTPRWTLYDAVKYGFPAPEGFPKTIQERAYSSPIWYQP